MNIKKIAFSFLLLTVSLFLFVNCDKVEEPYFKPVYTDRSALIELIADAQTLEADVYNDFGLLSAANPLIIPMVILSGDTSVEGNTLLANQMLSDFSLNTTDKLSMFNRDKSSGGYGVEKSNWDAHLQTELDKEGEFTLEVNSDDIDSTKILNGTIKITSLNLFENPLNLSIYILEDSIIANSIAAINVLHDSKSLFSNKKMERREAVETAYNYDLSLLSNISNVNVLYILSDAVTKEVLQVSKEELSYSDGGDQGYVPTFSDKQSILVEDFTGQKCGNCPNAHVVLSDLVQTHGSQVIPMAVHYGYFAEVDSYDAPDYQTDFTTDIADAIGNGFGVSATPKGLVNRVGGSGSGEKVLEPGDWDASIMSIINNSPTVGIDIKTALNGSALEATIYVKAFEQCDTALKVQAFIIENHIVSEQLWYGQATEHIYDYEHEHVLRASINGLWGEELTSAPFTQDQIIKKSMNYTLNADWNISNLALIVIVYNSETKTILQVKETHL